MVQGVTRPFSKSIVLVPRKIKLHRLLLQIVNEPIEADSFFDLIKVRFLIK